MNPKAYLMINSIYLLFVFWEIIICHLNPEIIIHTLIKRKLIDLHLIHNVAAQPVFH